MSDKYTISSPVFDACLSSNGLRKVTADSAKEEKEAVELFARYFKKEMHYENLQYGADRHDEQTVGFLFTESALDVCTEAHTEMPTRCVGGCSFRKVDGFWVLCWIWLHPFSRNKRLLNRPWKIFCEEFGNFYIEAPISPSMKNFISKQPTKHEEIKIGFR